MWNGAGIFLPFAHRQRVHDFSGLRQPGFGSPLWCLPPFATRSALPSAAPCRLAADTHIRLGEGGKGAGQADKLRHAPSPPDSPARFKTGGRRPVGAGERWSVSSPAAAARGRGCPSPFSVTSAAQRPTGHDRKVQHASIVAGTGLEDQSGRVLAKVTPVDPKDSQRNNNVPLRDVSLPDTAPNQVDRPSSRRMSASDETD